MVDCKDLDCLISITDAYSESYQLFEMTTSVKIVNASGLVPILLNPLFLYSQFFLVRIRGSKL